MKGTYNIHVESLWCPNRCDSWPRAWSTFVSLCRSLYDSRLHYKILIIENDGKYSLRVDAWGTPTFKHKPSKPSTIKIKIPAPLTVKRCRREQGKALETIRGLLREMKSAARLNNPYRYPRERYEFIPRKNLLYKINRNRKLGKWLAQRISTKGTEYGMILSYSISRSDYTELDAICGFSVTRYNKLHLHARKRVQDYAKDYAGRTIQAYVRTVLCDSFWFGSKTRWASQCDRCQMTPIDLIGYEKAKADVDHWAEMLRLVEER